jgi:hypothetical protein
MPALRWVLGGCLAAALHLSSHSASVISIGNALFVQGPIRSGDFDRFSEALRLHGPKTVFLSSPGGSVAEALKTAELIRSRGLATHVPRGATCASACVLLLAGGLVRTAEEGSRIGIHMGSGILNEKMMKELGEVYRKHGPAGTAVIGSIFEQNAALSTLRQVNFFLSAGVSLNLLKAAADVNHLDIRWLTFSEAREFNLLNSTDRP